MEIKILYEDEYILALDKPSGLLAHSDGRSKEKTLVDWINENYPELKEVGEEQILQNDQKIKKPGIVHRLDKETSGVIIVAKTKESYQFLKEQFQNRKIEKIYNAIVWGNFSNDKKEGVINKSIGRSASDFRKWSAEYGAKGEKREAVTEYKVIWSGKDQKCAVPALGHKGQGSWNSDFCSLLEVRPKTGRTHQIRVHLKSIGHPVVGDKLYGHNFPALRVDSSYTKRGKDRELINRLMLHAVSIKLELPNHTHITIESPLPEEFENIKNLLKNF